MECEGGNTAGHLRDPVVPAEALDWIREQRFALQIRAETEEMYSLCSDVQENLPLDKESFPMITRLRFCKYCNFKELCDRV